MLVIVVVYIESYPNEFETIGVDLVHELKTCFSSRSLALGTNRADRAHRLIVCNKMQIRRNARCVRGRYEIGSVTGHRSQNGARVAVFTCLTAICSHESHRATKSRSRKWPSSMCVAKGIRENITKMMVQICLNSNYSRAKATTVTVQFGEVRRLSFG